MQRFTETHNKNMMMLELAALRSRAKNIESAIKDRSWGVDWHSSQDLEMTKERIVEIENVLK